ncbi:pancreatic triacylglycerol lipase [Ornithorhynchus anatinus]|uniref:pancreatic triacylglycerol lipase n=1 Tax=Ornithorhynchus anatinus TaxID=9258 RepID=UPI0019D4527E|nr:pancreatic triacylglycerol lipase [Ornithorhynchus anatinus]
MAMMLPIWMVTLVLLGTVIGKEVCFERLGCFSDEIPWAGTIERPLKVLPWSPEKINTRFLLYTNENPDNFQELYTTDPSTIQDSNFKIQRKTRFIIHGFIDQGEENWLSNMCKRMTTVEQVNCICVDWKSGSRTGYTQASNNIRVVGAEVAYLIDILSSKFGYSLSDIHVIGHSLGAHAAGEAGSRVNGTVGRITGLDPAEPCFEGTSVDVRLDPSDADFVDVIHTDSAPTIPYMGFGTSQLVGHLDFFPNGGKQMPGCKKNPISQIIDIEGIWEGTRDFVACNHLRSYKFYSDSIINPNGFTGFPCDSYNVFQANKCFPCPSGGCPQMGHYADNFTRKANEVGKPFYLNTADASNFSRWRYKVSVTLSGSRVSGEVKITLFGSNGNTRQYDIYKGSLKPGATHSNEFDAELDVGDLQKVKFIWDNHWINPTLPRVGAATIVVQTADGKKYNFCSKETVRENVLLTLTPC